MMAILAIRGRLTWAQAMNITGGTQVMWEQSGKAYKYKIETSNDNINWTLKVGQDR